MLLGRHAYRPREGVCIHPPRRVAAHCRYDGRVAMTMVKLNTPRLVQRVTREASSMSRTTSSWRGRVGVMLAALALAGCGASARPPPRAETVPPRASATTLTMTAPTLPIPTLPPPPTPATHPAVEGVIVKGPEVYIAEQLDFERGQATLKAGSAQNEQGLARLKAWLDVSLPVTKLRIDGYADDLDTPAANLELSGQRALAIKNRLIGMGVKKERLLAVGFGQHPGALEEHPQIEFNIVGIRKELFNTHPVGGKVFE